MTLDELHAKLREKVAAEQNLSKVSADAGISYPNLYYFVKDGRRMRNYDHLARLATYYGYEITVIERKAA